MSLFSPIKVFMCHFKYPFLSGDFLTFTTRIGFLDLLPVFDLEEQLDQGYRIRTLPWRYRRGAKVLLVGETGETGERIQLSQSCAVLVRRGIWVSRAPVRYSGA